MKAISVFVIFILLFPLFSNSASAALVNLNNDGKVIINVLSAQENLGVPQSSNLEIKKIANGSDTNLNSLNLYKDGEEFKLSLVNSEGKSNLDVTKYKEELIEIEETPQKQKVKISLSEDKFKISQDNFSIYTTYPIEINPQTKKISVKTDTGVKYLGVLPKEAYESLLKVKTFTKINDVNSSSLEEANGILVYKLTGTKTINLFNVMDYETNIEAKINAQNGEIVFTNEPIWLKLMSLFLS